MRPTGYLSGPCGVAPDSAGDFYVSDHYHRAIDFFSSATSYQGQPLPGAGFSGDHQGPLDDPCGLALDAAGTLYVNNYHRDVVRFPAPLSPATGAVIDASHPTGVAVGSGDRVYVDDRTYIAVYDSAGDPVLNGGEPLRIGVGTLGDGYGLAVSAFPATAGFLYVPDASTDTVKVYDPATDPVNPVAEIDGTATQAGDFVSLRDSAVAVDRVSGDVYVVDELQPDLTESPEAIVHVFDSAGAYLGHLKYDVVDGLPTGLAVDNSAAVTQGRVYVTSGNTHDAGIYVYSPGAATNSTPRPPTIPPPPLGGGPAFPTVPIGAAATAGSGIACQSDACQILPPEPTDPTLTTLLPGLGNPRVRYHHATRSCRSPARSARHPPRTRNCRRPKGPRATGSLAPSISSSPSMALPESADRTSAEIARSADAGGPVSSGLLPGTAGFDAAVWADGGEAATLAGSHPYQLDLNLALDQSAGAADLRDLGVELPPGLLVNPANATGTLCSATAFATTRSSPFAPSLSGESCPERSQVGTVDLTVGAGQPRRFGLFNLQPEVGSGALLAASPYGIPLVFALQIRSGSAGPHFALQATDIPQGLQLHRLELSLWGAPWDASHNGERGNCLDEAEPGFPWAKCSVGEPLNTRPFALLTLPTRCGEPLSFSAAVSSWQQSVTESVAALSREAGGALALLADCSGLHFEPHPDGLLSAKKASSSSGYVFRLGGDDPGLTDPRIRIRSLPRKAVVELPRGVTLNPSLGAGLRVCTPAQLAAESAFNPAGGGCPNGAKIGVFSLRSPFYTGLLDGGIYFAQPDDSSTSAPGAENPFDSLLAVYLIAKSADRGILVKVAGELSPSPGDGTLTASFDGLPQLPFTDLEVNFRSGQRAPLITPPACGPATTTIAVTPWAEGAGIQTSTTDSPIATGIDSGPCPDGSLPPFSPGALAGGVNSNVGSYTPYYVHLSRRDTEQEITSYSLVLPRGITGKLAGIPFCPDAAIAVARANRGFAESADPSCPSASEVGHTLTGYGVGPALTYAPGRIYLAGPYHGSPLSLVTVNAATVGPFDLGTVVIRSAFDIDPRTAQLRIDSHASDPIPHIIDGVVLHLRDIRIYLDRPQFTHNPSSCEPSALLSTLTGSGADLATSADDPSATSSQYFQLLNCLTLGFEPKLGLRLRDGSRRGSYPSLRASFASRGAKDSNLKRIAVTMPHSMFLAQEHIRTVCTREQFDAERCPAGSIYGRAVAETPLFDEPLRGNVYLRSSSNRLPDLVADLRSGEVRIIVEGRIGPSQSGGIRTFFDNLPDAPIERFTMTLYGGRRGLLVNSANICNSPPLASVKALGQNNVGAIFSSTLRGQCKQKQAKPRHGGHRRGGER